MKVFSRAKEAEKELLEDSSTPCILLGRYDRKLGCDKLLTLPSEWLESLGGVRHVFVLPDQDERCLNIVPAPLMEKELDRLRAQVSEIPAKLSALQTIGSETEELELDRRHRIRICDRLLEWAGITNAAALVGCIRIIKVWAPEVLSQGELQNEKAIGKDLAELLREWESEESRKDLA